MNRENAKELWPIIKAFGDGEGIEYQSFGKGAWVPKSESCGFDQAPSHYRIKPKEPREFWVANTGDEFPLEIIPASKDGFGNLGVRGVILLLLTKFRESWGRVVIRTRSNCPL